MKITFTESAVQYINSKLEHSSKHLKFLHDKGLGCGDLGTPTLILIDQPGDDDVLGDGYPIPFYYDPRHEIYYEPEMKIDYNPQKNDLILKSDGQIYTYNMRILNASS